MKANKTILSILKQAWAIEPSFANASLPFIEKLLAKEDVEPQSEAPEQTVTIQEGVAIYSIDGPMMKHDGLCSIGTASYASAIRSADENPKVHSHLLIINSPGGTVEGTEYLGNTIRDTQKHFVAQVDEMAASAAYWAVSQANEIYMSGNTSMVGSIGVLMKLADDKKSYKTFTAESSPDKNGAEIKALAGDDTELQDSILKPLHAQFQQAVIDGRNALVDRQALTGKMYLAEKAVQMKLADGIQSAQTTYHNLVINRNNNMSLFSKTPKLSLLLMAAVAAFNKSEMEDSHLDSLNAELEEQGIGFRVASTTELDQTQAQLDAATLAQDKIKTLEGQVETLETAKTNLKDKVKTLENAPGAAHTEPAASTDPNPESEQDQFYSETDAMLKKYSENK